MPVTLKESADKAVEALDLSELKADQKKKMKAESKRGLNALLLVGPVAANGFDAATTRAAMRAGGREANPAVAIVADSPVALYVGKAGIGLATAAAAEALAKTGHRTLGKIVAGLGMAVPVAAGIHNMEMAKNKGR